MKKEYWKKPTWYLFLLTLLLSAVLIVQLFLLAMIPIHFVVIATVVVLLMDLLFYFLLVSRKANKVNRILGSVLSVVLCIGMVVGNLYLFKTNSLFEDITHSGEQKNVVSVVVKSDSDIESVQDLKQAIGYAKTMDADGTKQLFADIKEKEQLTLQQKEYNSLIDVTQALKDGDCEAMVLNESYRSMVSENAIFEDFDQDTKVIYTYTYYTKVDPNAKAVDVSKEAFTVLISGIDVYGDIAATSRSDVNLLVTVNPLTKEILMVSIPRDYYVETACDAADGCGRGQMDKLTHTGLHGAHTTQATLEKLFGIEINYTLRVNFSSVQTIVDALGGIEVDNPQTFRIGGYTFEPGRIHLDGDQALMFSRERKSFGEGDRERGRNQMRVFSGILDKVTSPAILTNYMSILDAVGDSFETNMSSGEMKSLVQMQLNDRASWHIQQMSVDGANGNDYCYELQNTAWVMYPDMDTVDAAVKAMETVTHGGRPDLE